MPTCVLRYCTNNSRNSSKSTGVSFHQCGAMVPPSEAATILMDILFPYLRDSNQSPEMSRQFNPLVESLRRSRTTANYNLWVEHAPGSFKSEHVPDNNRHTRQLYTLLAIKNRREEEAREMANRAKENN